MLSPPEHIGTLRLWPTTTREVRGVVIRLIIAVFLILLIGALSRSVALARRTNKHEQLDLHERFQAEQRLGNLGYWAGAADGNFDYSYCVFTSAY
jgi:hypothetical protein